MLDFKDLQKREPTVYEWIDLDGKKQARDLYTLYDELAQATRNLDMLSKEGQDAVRKVFAAQQLNPQSCIDVVVDVKRRIMELDNVKKLLAQSPT